MVASRRARQITLGAHALVEEENDKPTVLALREIAEGKVDATTIRDSGRRIDEDVQAALGEIDGDLGNPATSSFKT